MPEGYYRFPTIHEDTIVFACEDDLWTIHAAGGIARRLTSNLGEVSHPVLSPDGKQLAFVGRDEGESDIYVMPALGGAARRLTYMAGSLCTTAGWTADGKILFANNAKHWYLRFTYMYTVDSGGNPPQRLEIGPLRTISYGPSGGVVIGRNTDEPARWKRYRGGRVGQLWIDRNEDGSYEPLIQLKGDLTSPLWIGEPGSEGRVYFISDHEGVGNLYSCTPNGDDLQRHTDHEQFYARNASTDGKRIVYHAGADLFLYDLEGKRSDLVPIELHSPQVQRKRRFVDTGKYLHDYQLHPKGQFITLTTRGKLFSFANWEAAVLQQGESQEDANDSSTVTGVRFRLSRWLQDGERLIALTDEGGEEHFVIFNADGSGEPVHLPDLDIGRPDEVIVSPKKDQIVFSNHRYEIMFLDLENHELRLIDRGSAAPISGFDWSPDGRWVVYSVSVSLQTIALKLWNLESGEIHKLTEPVLRDVNPAFDPQGRYIYFISHRIYDPVYDNMQFDLGFPLGMKPYLITLQKDLTTPFILQPKVAEDEPEKEENEIKNTEQADRGAEGQENGVEDGEAQDGEEPIQIDLEGIERRLVAFPLSEGIYGRVLATSDGKMHYTCFPPEGALGTSFLDDFPEAKGSLYYYNLDEQKEELLVRGVSDFNLSSDGETLIYRSKNRLRVIKPGEKPPSDENAANRKTGWIDLNRVKVSIMPGSEWRQMFREAWRLQRDQFWTEDMSKVDWIAIHDRYLPLVDRVSSRSEFSDLMWEMQGELGTSHCYEFGGDYRPGPTYNQGYLGADFGYNPDLNGWRVSRIYKGDVWDEQSDSPLGKPGINVEVGDTLVAVNGRRLSRTLTPIMALVNLAGEQVTLTIIPGDDGDSDSTGERFVTVKTLMSEKPVLYREWVENNRRYVHEATGGRIGYVHIPDMGAAGYGEFHRGYLAEVDREGLIVDVRYNRGGHVSALLLEKLSRRRLGYDTSRWGEIPESYPPESVLGPMVALTNEYAGSDGDIFSHGFKLLSLGPLIGKRTWGGVIGIWPRHSLVDGTVTTQPEFSFWFSDVGWGVENYGTDPDIEVENRPQDYARGVDPQLDRGLQEIQRMLEENPPQVPEFKDRPSLALPKLPKR